MTLEIREVAGFGSSESRAIIGVTIMFLVISTISVLGRFISRHMKSVSLGGDDWLMLGGLGRAVTTNGRVGFHMETLSQSNRMKLFQIPYGITMTLIRCSICMFFIRIFTQKIKKAGKSWVNPMYHTQILRKNSTKHNNYFTVYAVVCLNVAWGLFVIIAAAAICVPFRYNWDKEIEGGKCGNQLTLYIVIAAWALLCDVIIWVIPFSIVWKLQLPVGQKVAISGIFALGVIDMIVSIFRIISLLGVDFYGDFSYTVVKTDIWSTSEPGIAILIGCGPILRPVLQRIMPFRFLPGSRSNISGYRKSNSATTRLETRRNLRDDQIELKNTTDTSDRDMDRESDLEEARWETRVESRTEFGTMGKEGNGERGGISVTQEYSVQRSEGHDSRDRGLDEV
ncbi:integral membrane protein [Rutstroemia sp. NJR-2017a BVV2]|nr:integral membrane protein [Rutstroemia sp. NJR-2017a BVV2]